LSNGLKVAAEETNSETATIALHVEAGTRNEKLNGVSNFISRLAGKGTVRYNQQQLETELAKLGAELNIKVNREYTSFTVRSLSKDATKAVDIISDVVKNAVYDENKLNIERQRVLDELTSFKDYETITMDYLYSVAYQGTPLAHSLQGSRENIKKITRNDILQFIDNNYKAPRMVLTSVGGVKQDCLAEAAEKTLSDVSIKYPGEVELVTPCRFTASDVQHRDDAMPVAHVATALEGCSLSDPAAIPLQIANSILGSGDKSSGGWELVHRDLQYHANTVPGFYSFRSFNHQYSDQGLFGLYVSAVPEVLDDVCMYGPRLWVRLCTSLVDSKVEMGKKSLRRQILLDHFDQSKRSESLAQEILFQGGRKNVQDTLDEINSFTTKQLSHVFYDYVYDQGFARGAYGPTEAVSDYNMTQSSLYWVRW
jgi:predicted Zn-dependent peptidase